MLPTSATDIDDNGKLKITYDENFTAELAEGISFQPQAYEAWKAG
jgi:hypothetical protein